MLILLEKSSFFTFSQKPQVIENQKVAYLLPREISHEMAVFVFSNAHRLPSYSEHTYIQALLLI